MSTSSVKQIKANQQNSLKSTGPNDTSSTKFNARKHGLLSKEVLMAGEKSVELSSLRKGLYKDLAPQGDIENLLVERIVAAVWRLKRAIKVESEYLTAEFKECRSDSFTGLRKSISETWRILVSQELGQTNTWFNLTRYETSIEKQLYKAMHELQRIQSARKGEKPPLPMTLDVDVSQGN